MRNILFVKFVFTVRQFDYVSYKWSIPVIKTNLISHSQWDQVNIADHSRADNLPADQAASSTSDS